MRHSFALMICLMGMMGCDWPGRPDPANKFVRPGDVLDFATLFAKNCAGCHGAEGKLGPAPPLNDPIFLAIVPDAELTKVVTHGRAGTSMPAFAKEQGGTLGENQVQALVKGLREKWGKSAPAGDRWPSYLTKAQGDVNRGKAIFAKACAICHGDDGKGNESIGSINDSVFLELSSEQVLRRLIITGRPDLGMPDSADSAGRPLDFVPLTSADVDDLVALLVSWK